MPLSAEKKKLIMDDHKSGKMTVKSILEKHKIAKATFYSLKKREAPVIEEKKVQFQEPEPEPDSDSDYIEISEEEPAPKNVRSRTFKMDPKEAGLTQLNAAEFPPEEEDEEEYIPEPAYQTENKARYDQSLPPNIPNSFNPGQNMNMEPDPMNFDNIVKEFNLYDPLNMTKKIKEAREKPKVDNTSIPKQLYDPKSTFKEQSKDERKVEDEEKKQKCVYVIRKYIYAFKDNLGLQSIVGKTHDAREKFVYMLFNKSLNELQKIESMIKYHVRAELSGTSQMFESVVLAGVKIVETIGTRVNLKFEGLTSEIQQEINEKGQLFTLLQEIQIEMGVDAYTSPKKELVCRLGMKLMEIDSKNRAIEAHLGAPINQAAPPVTDSLHKSYNETLETKYNDL
jgi:hypothetical protein